jgi:flagellar biosynthetic protein FliP
MEARQMRLLVAGLILGFLIAPAATLAQDRTIPVQIDNPANIPDFSKLLPPAQDSAGVSTTMQIFVIMTVLTIVPSILILTTSFARIMIVLALMRQAMGVPQLPPGQVLMGLSLFMTMLVMAPTWGHIKSEAIDPYLDNSLSQEAAFDTSLYYMRDFMLAQIKKTENEADIFLFLEHHRGAPIGPEEEILPDDVPTTVLIPAFILSELKTAFIMGFKIYLPFLVIDMVIASILISMGMMMLPPVLISLPFKLLLFVLADGWHLVAGTLIESFG